MNVVGEVKGRHCLLVDDLIDTAGTLVKGAEALLEKGAVSVSACATHAVLSGSGGKPDRRILFEGSGSYEFDSAFGRGEEVEPDQVVVDREVAGAKPSGRYTRRLR